MGRRHAGEGAARRPGATRRALRQALALGALLPSLLGLGGCLSIDGDACVGPDTTASATVLDPKEAKPRNCDGNFLSARNQRAVLYGGDDHPRLWTGEKERAAADISPGALNVALPSGYKPARVTGFMDAQRIDYPADDAAAASDVADLRSAGGAGFDPNERVTVNFKKATIDFVLKQILGGALRLNYVAPDDLGGSITFHTEEPTPKGQLLQIVRDILARNGLEMRKANGIYEIGKHELLQSMEALGAEGRGRDRVTRVVHLRKANGPEILALARQLMPPEVAVTPTNAPDTLLVGASPDDIDQAETILKNLAASGIGDDHIAVIPLHQGAPEKIAQQIGDFYRSRGIAGLTILPLDRQQGILVATKDATNLSGVKQLARMMDSEVRDEVSLRIIPLKYLRAADVAQRLATLFGSGGEKGGSGSAGGGGGLGSGFGGSGSLQAPTSSGAQLGAGLGVSGGGPGNALLPKPPAGDLAPAGPSTAGPLGASGDSASGAGRSSVGGGSASGAVGSASGPGGGGSGEQTKIVADPGSNAVMVYSGYALFKRVSEALRVLDVPQSQVVIEATIVEVTLNDQLQSGVQVFLSGHGLTAGSGDVGNPLTATASATGSTGTTAGTSTTGTTGTVAGSSVGTTGTVSSTVGTSGAGTNGFSANTGGLLSIGANLGHGYQAQAVIAALQGITKVKVISSPYLTVTNGKEARLVVGDQIPYSTRTQSSNNLGNNTTTNEVTIKDTGIVLDITPEIHSNNEVELKISQSVSTPNETSPLGGVLTPVISTRSVDSDVLLQSGHTVLLGGLIQDRLEQSEGGVPVLRTAPVIGDLFKSKSDAVLRTELVLLLTPRVTRTTSQMEGIAHILQGQIHTR